METGKQFAFAKAVQLLTNRNIYTVYEVPKRVLGLLSAAFLRFIYIPKLESKKIDASQPG
jgi:hypothetical protein